MRTSTIITAAVAGIAALSFAAMAQEQNPPGAATLTDPASANECDKLTEVQCGSRQGCSWLPGYRVPNGAEVKGYCRPMPRSIKARRSRDGASQ